VRLSQVRLQAPAAAMAAQAGFYGGELGLEVSDGGWQIGWSQLAFSPATAASGPPPEPFYHFALLVPGDRFAAARDWAQQRVELLEIFDSGEVVIRFDNWGADACYFHDPAENIVELIAHDQVGVSGADGPFRAAELLGLAEIGLVGERVRVAAALAELGLEIFQGSVDPARRSSWPRQEAAGCRGAVRPKPGRRRSRSSCPELTARRGRWLTRRSRFTECGSQMSGGTRRRDDRGRRAGRRLRPAAGGDRALPCPVARPPVVRTSSPDRSPR
jgi:hypothetical protein